MPYHPNLSEKPQTILALYNGQEVQVCGLTMYFQCKSNSEKVFLTTRDDYGAAFMEASSRYMLGAVGYTKSPPIYSDYYQHVRERSGPGNIGRAEFTREELVELLTSGNYDIE